MGHWWRSKTALSTVILFGTAAQPAFAQTHALPPPPPLPIPGTGTPLPPPPWATAARPTENPTEWVTVNDYPLKALREELQGMTGFRVTIGTDGTVTGCTITSTSGTPELDEATCRLVNQRARFSPALNAKGEPVIGQYSSRIRWVIPKDAATPGPTQIAPFSRIISFWVEADGSVSQCRVIANGVDVTTSDRKNPCTTGQRVAPLVDTAGNPVRRFVTLSSSLTISDPSAKSASRKRRGN